jgi:transporter family-2 protein
MAAGGAGYGLGMSEPSTSVVAQSAGPDLARLGLMAAVILVGALLPVQAGMNAVTRAHFGHPLYAGLLNFIVGLLAITALLLASKPAPLQPDLVRAAPCWVYLAGLIGASVVVIAAIAAPRLGASLMFACLIGGQLAASVLIDHFGLARYPVRPMNLERVLGVCLLIAGVLLIQRSSRAIPLVGGGSP